MMALPFLVRSCLLHVSRAARATALTSVSGIGPQRCFSSITAGLRAAVSRVCALHPPVPSPLLGQCQKLTHVQPTCGMKTKTALKRRCKDCFFVRRRGRLFVYCKTHPRHKQRQG